MTTDTRSELASTAAHWDKAFEEGASAEQREASYALASPLYQQQYENKYFGNEGWDWVEWVKRTLCPDRILERGLVLGCGLGDGLLDFQRRQVAARLHGVDLSAKAIECARASARAAGLSDVVTFEVGDFHTCALDEGAYDIVFMVMSLHHALDLDRAPEKVSAALRPGGIFVANEYIGPSRWQHTNLQLLWIKAFLTALPRALRRKADGSVKGRIGRPTIQWMMETDPSEAAHSAAIPERLAHYFDVVHRIDYGGAIAVPVLDQIIGNFTQEDARAMAWFRAITWVDRVTWRWGIVPSANAILVGRKR